MQTTTYKEQYNLTANFIAIRQNNNKQFSFKYFKKPNKKHFNVGMWVIKYKM